MYFNKINCQLFLLGFGSVLTTNSIMSFPVLKLVGCHFCTATLLNKVHFSLSTTFAQGSIFPRHQLCTRRHFCKATFLHGRYIYMATFCNASLLPGVVLLRKYLCTARFLNNWLSLNGAKLLHASNFSYIK